MTAGDRRRQLAETAARQFHHVGFHRVTVADVANEVGVTPPAIYRHFANKEALLFAAVESGLARVEEILDAEPDASWPERVALLADAAAERRDLWVLLQREMRHISPDARKPLDERFSRLILGLRAELVAVRPDLDPRDAGVLVTAILAVLSSQSVYSARYPAADRCRVLALVALALTQADLKSTRGRGVTANADGAATIGNGTPMPPRTQESRSESLLALAVELFHARGFDAVSLDDIGAAAGMAGPSVLHHYPTKSDLLVAAFKRATEQLTATRARSASQSLVDLAEIYIDVGVRERLLLGVYVLEIASLPAVPRAEIAAELQRDIEAWERALRLERPELTEAEATILVHAARAIVHDVARVGHFHDRPAIREEMATLLGLVLSCDLGSPTSPGE